MEKLYAYIAMLLDHNFLFSMVVAQLQSEVHDQSKTCRWVSSRVELIKYASNSHKGFLILQLHMPKKSKLLSSVMIACERYNYGEVKIREFKKSKLLNV